MKINKKRLISHEIVHFYNSLSGDYIASTGNAFEFSLNNQIVNFKIRNTNPFIKFRILRRLFRLDKSNAFFNFNKTLIIVLYQGTIFNFSIKNKALRSISKLRQCRCVLHNSIAITKNCIVFGEYGRNPSGEDVPLWVSRDDGKSFEVLNKIKDIKHIHGAYKDPYTNSIWVTTGDHDGECFLIEFLNEDFLNPKFYGDGSQQWRTVSLMFRKDKIFWIMDSPNAVPKLQILDRSTLRISQGMSFDAPVWYTKRLSDNSYLAQTSIEPGNAVKSKHSKIFYSSDLINWHQIASFKKDLLPKILFKFGVVFFSEGHQTKDDFIISGEALLGLDGRSWNCSIKES
tara:strand:- start:4649 stop:5677 length:1029 start_codon:yes stop_codon:yes gene_type:complete